MVPTTANPARPRREEILDCATRLFAERGYEGTSMADLAASVGMRKASLFYHFASKDVLYAAVMDRLVNGFRTLFGQVPLAAGTYEERLDAITDGVTTLLGQNPFAARLLVREAMDWGVVTRGNTSEEMTAIVHSAATFLRAGQSAGAFVAADGRQLLLSVLGLHFLPFCVLGLADRLAARDDVAPPSLSDPSVYMAFANERREIIRTQVRALVLTRAS